jgi:hypothetical protein
MPVGGREIRNITPTVQFFYTPGISIHRANSRQCHEFLSADGEWVLEPVQVPELKQYQVKANVIGGHPLIV